MWMIILVVTYALIPNLAAFMLGYGGMDKDVSTLFQVFIGSLLLLVMYDIYVFVVCLWHAAHKTIHRFLTRFITISAMLLYLVLVAPRLSPWFGRLGADTRLRVAGGDVFCSRLFDDVDRLLSEAETQHTSCLYIEKHNLPESFRQLGAMSAKVYTGSKAQVVLETSGRPYRTRWILVPSGSEATITRPQVKVRPRIYRRY